MSPEYATRIARETDLAWFRQMVLQLTVEKERLEEEVATLQQRIEELEAQQDPEAHAEELKQARELVALEYPGAVIVKNSAQYQAVVPSTWNGGPRDAKGQRGPYEEALVGTPIADPKKPLEVLRTVHSFDPCMACAAHLVDVSGRELGKVRIR